MENQTSAFINDEKVYNSPIKSQPKPERNIGIDTKEVLFDNIANAGISSQLDISALESFSNVSQSRDQLYAMLDTMSQDSIVSAVLETYAEDATEYNDNGRIVWAESADGEVSKYITFLLDTIGADKHIYKWVYSLCKYGDLYLKLFRESESKDLLFDNEDEKDNTLNEDVNIKAFSKNDRYTHYVEMVPNPAEIFELTKFGKTYGYIKAPTRTPAQTRDNLQNIYFKYKFNKADIDVYNATEFVHASLEDNSSRTPEEVNIFLDKDNDDNHLSYTVRRGQSLLYNVFKIWRELNLLENSVLLNRITKSSIVRVINVEVGDMPKENVGPHLTGIKQLIEQKSALNEGSSLNEYTNPGPIENNVYVPTRAGQGALTTQQIGGDVDVKSLADLDYFKNKFFGALRVPKQYFGDTDDGAGFNGGQSLSIISSRYAKMVKRIQNTVLQALTDAINLMLLDKGLDSYVNRFELKMLPPTTQEEIDRRENLSSKIQIATDIMNTLGEVEDSIVKIKILKSLLSTIVNDSEVITLIEDYIDKLEKEANAEEPTDVVTDTDEDTNDNFSMSGGSGMSDLGGGLQDDLLGDMSDETDEFGGEESTDDESSGEDETILPSPADLELDLTDNNTEI